MADGDQDAKPWQKAEPWAQIPVAFADGIMSHSFSPGVSKIYFYRTDPDPNATGTPSYTPVVQLIISNTGLVSAFAFLEKRIKVMLAEKAITQEQIDTARKVDGG